MDGETTINKDKDKWIDAGKRQDGERGWMDETIAYEYDTYKYVQS